MDPKPNPSARRRNGRPGSPRLSTSGLLAACLFASVASGAYLLLADDSKPPAAASQEEDPKSEKPRKPPTDTKAATKSSQARPSKSPAPEATPAPALSFTDFDLEKYHKEKPAEEAEEETEEEPMAPVPPPSAGAVRPAMPKAMKPAKPAPAAPKSRPTTAPVADEDPLKPFRDREAREKIRTEQIQTMRAKLSDIQTRLDYLQARKRAIQDPLAGMPKPPAGATPGDDAALKPKELLAQVDAEIKALLEEREQAQDELASIETRFAQESTSR
jgi:hypothetical protein